MIENWLTDLIYDNEVTPPGYLIYRNDRGSRGGGVAIVLSNQIPSRLIQNHQIIEMISVEISLDPKVILVCVYISPSSSDAHLGVILDAISSLPDNCDILITGDFNCPDINWLSLTGVKPFSQSLCNILYDKNYLQLVTTPTHNQRNKLDLVLSNSPNRIFNLSTDSSRCSAVSDHFLISFSASSNHREPKVCQAETPLFFNYKMSDFCAIDDEIAVFVFNPTSANNIDSVWEDLKTAIINARKPTPTKLQKLADLQSCIHHLMESAKVEYESSLVATFGSSPRKLYSFLRDLGKNNSMPNFFHHNNSVIDNSHK